MSILIGILTFTLIAVSVFLVLVILAQKSKDGGMGAALGGGATESAFGHETGNVLTNLTVYATVLFFLLSFVLYLFQLHQSKHQTGGGVLPAISASPTTAPSSMLPALEKGAPPQPFPGTLPGDKPVAPGATPTVSTTSPAVSSSSTPIAPLPVPTAGPSATPAPAANSTPPAAAPAPAAP